MEPNEYELLSRIEDHHWWFRAQRDVVARILDRLDLPERPSVLDAGCGTGANLALLRDRLAPSYLGGLDLSPRAVELARAKVPQADVYVSDLADPELRRDAYDLVTCIDVIYSPGVEAVRPGLERLVGRLAPGGRLIVHVPALEWLRGEHDDAVHGTERYTRDELRTILHSLGLRVELLGYRLCPLLPAVVAARWTSRARRRRAPGDAPVSDLHREPPAVVGRLLEAVCRVENRAVVSGLRMPWGSSLVAVGRRPGRGSG